MSDEKKDLKPLLEATKQIDYFIKKYPETDYSTWTRASGPSCKEMLLPIEIDTTTPRHHDIKRPTRIRVYK